MLLESKSGNWKHLPEKWQIAHLIKAISVGAFAAAKRTKTMQLSQTTPPSVPRLYTHSLQRKWRARFARNIKYLPVGPKERAVVPWQRRSF